MRSLKHAFATMMLMFVMAGCSENSLSEMKDRKPMFSLEEFFAGQTVAYGIFEDRFGKLRRQFRVNITGKVDGNTLILDEDFLYDDGEKANRIWMITNMGRDAEGNIQYRGEAEDIVGVATGAVAGNALNWSYIIDLETGGNTLRVKFNDWIYQQDEHVAINRAYVKKFGVEIGSVTLVFLRGKAAETLGPLDLSSW
ncbi:DUF3833 domain-containing protein [Alphaproteobacteria bacterium LSUCC0684]